MIKSFLKNCWMVGVMILLLTGLGIAQQASSSRDSNSAPSVSSTPAVSTPAAGNSVPSISYGGTTSYGSVSSGRDSNYLPSNGGSYQPSTSMDYSRFINSGTSFWNYDSFERTNLLFMFLRTQYPGRFGYSYFNRYITNNEPIVTRDTAIAMRVPSGNAKMLVAIADQLQVLRTRYAASGQSEQMLQDPQVKTLIQKARVLAKQIYSYPAVDYLNVGKVSNLTSRISNQDVEGNLNQMDSFIRMLQGQFRDIWESDNPSLISVQQLAQPSPISLAKGIEKLAQQLEKANKS